MTPPVTLSGADVRNATVARLRAKVRRTVEDSTWHARFFARPYMWRSEVKALETVLRQLPEERRVRILEYGCGGSTLYYAKFMKREGRAYEWISVEGNREWAERIQRLARRLGLDSVSVHYASVPGIDETLWNRAAYRKDLLGRQGRIPCDGYTQFPRTTGRSFDLVIVDGRDRKNCVNVALDVLAPGGCVVLHDAIRSYYRCLIDAHPEGRLLSGRLWQLRKDPAAKERELPEPDRKGADPCRGEGARS